MSANPTPSRASLPIGPIVSHPPLRTPLSAIGSSNITLAKYQR